MPNVSIERTIGSLLNQIYEVDSFPPEGIYDWANSNGIKIIYIEGDVIRIVFNYYYMDSDNVLALHRINKLVKGLEILGYKAHNSSVYGKYDRTTEGYRDYINVAFESSLGDRVQSKGFRTLLGIK